MMSYKDFIEQNSVVILDYAKILIPSFITFLVTRYTMKRPQQYELRSKQFDSVYLPLYLLCMQFKACNDKDFKIFIRKVDKIIYKNYPLVYPKTLKLFDKMKKRISSNEKGNYASENFFYQVESDYEKLKRELGYPTDSIFEFFKRLNKLDRFFYLAAIISLLLGVFCVINSFVLFFSLDILDALFALITSLLCFFTAYIMHYTQR